ncbi:MAG: hypothetical protein ABJC87_01785 [Roseobacter sp.]
MLRLKMTFIAAFTVLAASIAECADFQVVTKSDDAEEFARIHLAGPISEGDAANLDELFRRELIGYYADTHYVTLTMDSPGGSYSEGLKLMDLFRELQIATRVSENASCMSACAIAFMGGSRILANTFSTSRTVEPGGKLGFHAPSLNLEAESLVPAQLLQTSYAEALSAIAGVLERRDQFEIQTSLVERILSTPPSETYILETVDDFARWGITVDLDQSSWQPDAEDIARMCLNTAIWRSGSSVAKFDKSMQTQQGARIQEERVDDWSSKVRFHEPSGQSGIRTVFAFASEQGMEISTCVVKLVAFRGQWHPSVFWSDSSPEVAIAAAKQSNSNEGTYMLHALPHDFQIEALR